MSGALRARLRSLRARAGALRARAQRSLPQWVTGPRPTPEDVHFAYRLLLGREPDPAGLAHWLARIDQMSLDDLRVAFLQSEEYRRRQHALLGAPREFVKPPLAPPVLSPLASQLATQAQIDSVAYWRWCEEFDELPHYHRKQWEYVYLLQALAETGMLRPGARGLGFGVGLEPIPAVLAKHGCDVVVTDLGASAAEDKGWRASQQHARELDELQRPKICSPDEFRARVRYRTQDMTALDDDLKRGDFDFVWSLCALEHLGSLQAGMRFVEQSLACVRPGGVAVHTTEYNLSSNDDTLTGGATVVYRQRDIEALAGELARAGHEVRLNLHPGDGPLDRYYDVPPYRGSVQLKIELQRYVVTSLGLLIRTRAA